MSACNPAPQLGSLAEKTSTAGGNDMVFAFFADHIGNKSGKKVAERKMIG
jgi:hypothetical protein